MRISDEELANAVAAVESSKERRKDRGELLYPEEWPVVEERAEDAILDLRDLRALCRELLRSVDQVAYIERQEGSIICKDALNPIRKHLEAE